MSEIKETKKTDILLVDPRNIIVVDGFNVRTDMGDIEALAGSIVELGLQVPLMGELPTHGRADGLGFKGHRLT